MTRSAEEPTVPAETLAPILSARRISKSYEMGDVRVLALREVDLDLFSGELVVLLGASGSGKSTLLNILGGLDTPTSGTIHYQDLDLGTLDRRGLTEYRRRHVGFVFQFYNLIPSLTARENVELVTSIAEAPLPADEALARVGLGDRMDHFPAQMSGGEQQRVAIARAVAKRPRVLLCDEPTGALDAETGKLVLSVLVRLNEELGTTTAIITHNAQVGGLGHRVLKMRSGEIVEEVRNSHRKTVDEIEW